MRAHNTADARSHHGLQCNGKSGIWHCWNSNLPEPNHHSVAEREPVQGRRGLGLVNRNGCHKAAGGTALCRQYNPYDCESNQECSSRTRRHNRKLISNLARYSKNVIRVWLTGACVTLALACTRHENAPKRGAKYMAQHDAHEQSSIYQVKGKHEFELMNIPGVSGVGLGEDVRQSGLVIKVYVERI